MSEHNITVKGGATILLPTGGKYCDRDILVTSEGISAEEYVGEYVVTPSRKTQIIETQNKLLKENITIVEIPYAEVSNLGGGNTFYIARE